MFTRRQFLRNCTGALLAVAGLSVFPGRQIVDKLSRGLPVLLYHRVGPESDSMTVNPARFQADLAFIRQEGYHTLSLAQIRQHIQEALPLPEKSVLITFDDGYLDNYTNAFPILQQYSMQASFYLITGMIGQPNRMTVPQIREMAAAGMDFGSHTVSHRPLAGLSTAEVTAELSQSKNSLEQMLGSAVEFTAYPCGSYTADTLSVAREAGYTGGFSTRYGLDDFSNRLLIRRIPIFHTDRSLGYVMVKKGFLPTMIS